MQKVSNKSLSIIGFTTSVIGLLGLLLGKLLLYIFPVPLVCGILLIKNKENKKDFTNGATCIIVAIILGFYIFA